MVTLFFVLLLPYAFALNASFVVSCNPGSVRQGQSTTCTATITGSGGITPSGTIQFDTSAKSTVQTISCTPCSQSLTITLATQNELVLIEAFSQNGASTVNVTSVSDTNLTPYSLKVEHGFTSGTFDMEIWAGINPISGSDTITVSWNNPAGTIAVVQFMISTYKNAGGTGNFALSIATTATLTVNITVTKNNGWIAGGGLVSLAGISLTPGPGQTQRQANSASFSEDLEDKGPLATGTQSFAVTFGAPCPCGLELLIAIELIPFGSVSFTTDQFGVFTPSNGICTLSGSGNTASCSVTYVPNNVGNHVITASYSGDANYSPGSSSTILPVARQPSLLAASMISGTISLFAIDSLYRTFKYGYIPEKKFRSWMMFFVTAAIAIFVITLGGI